MKYSRDYYRTRALQRRRDPVQDAKNAEAAEAMRQRVSTRLAASPVIQRMNAAAQAGQADASAVWRGRLLGGPLLR